MSEKRRRTYTHGRCKTVLVEYDDGGITMQQWQDPGSTSQVVALLPSEWEDMVRGLSAPPISLSETQRVAMRRIIRSYFPHVGIMPTVFDAMVQELSTWLAEGAPVS